MSVNCEKCSHPHERWVPLQRVNDQQVVIDALNVEKKTLLEGKATLDAQLSAAKVGATAAEGHVARIATLEGELATAASAWGVERSIISSGITSNDGIAFAQFAYDRLKVKPEGGMSAWLGNKEALPPGVAAYFPAAAGAAAAAAAGGGTGGDAAAAAAAAKVTADAAAAAAGGGTGGVAQPHANGGTGQGGGSALVPGTVAGMTDAQYLASRTATLAAGQEFAKGVPQ